MEFLVSLTETFRLELNVKQSSEERVKLKAEAVNYRSVYT